MIGPAPHLKAPLQAAIGPWTAVDHKHIADGNGRVIAEVWTGTVTKDEANAHRQLLAGSRGLLDASISACASLSACVKMVSASGHTGAAMVIELHLQQLMAAVRAAGAEVA